MADMLATPSDLASLLQRDVDTATATLLIELATARVQRAAGGQRIVDATTTAVIDVRDPCDYFLPLPQWPVRSVSAVLLDGVAISDWYLREQKLWRAVGWMSSWSPPSQVKATYVHGYPTDAQGLQLAKDACLSLAQMGYGNPDAATSEAIDDYRVTYADAEARMVMTETLRQAIADAYGMPAYVTTSR